MARMAARERDALGEARRAQIVEAAAGLWLRRGFDATSVEAIARAAGLAKGTVYLYFPSKEAVLDEAVRRYSLVPAFEALTQPLAGASLEEAIPRLARELWRRLTEQAPLVRLMLRELPQRPDLARNFLEKVVLPANRLFAGWLDAGVAAGAVRPLDTFVAARALVGMLMIFLLTQELYGGRALAPLRDDAITDTVADVFLRGVLRRENASPRAARARSEP
jgi:AcrR family transcriptional regulator